MNIMIHLGNQLMSEAIYQLLIRNGYDDVVASGRSSANGFTPHVLLVDITTLTYDLLAQYPQAKAFLIDDADIEAEKLYATLGSYKIGGTLSSHAGLQQVWVESGSVKASLHDTGAISKTGRRKPSSAVARGLSSRSPRGLRSQTAQ
jgi:hypothetical protein